MAPAKQPVVEQKMQARDGVKIDEAGLKALPLRLRWQLIGQANRAAKGEDVRHAIGEFRHLTGGNQKGLIAAAKLLTTNEVDDITLLKNCMSDATRLLTWVATRRITPEEALGTMVTAFVSDLDGVRYLLGKGIDPCTKMRRGMQLLHVAAQKGDAQLVELLIEFGAHLDAQCDDGYTPLHYACAFGQTDAAIIIRRCDPDLSILNNKGHTPLQCATATGFPELAIKLDRTIGVREEAILRARRFYMHLMEGEEEYWDPDPAVKSDVYNVGHLLAAVLVLRPMFIAGKRERRQLVPADLTDTERLGRKAFGKKWKEQTSVPNYRPNDPELAPLIAKIIFGNKLNSVEVIAALARGEAIYDALQKKKQIEFLQTEELRKLNEFFQWVANPDEQHRKLLLEKGEELTKRQDAATRLGIEIIIHREKPLTLDEFNALHIRDQKTLTQIRELYEARKGLLLGLPLPPPTPPPVVEVPPPPPPPRSLMDMLTEAITNFGV